MIILTISKEDDGKFLVDDRMQLGSPPVGRGHMMKEAIGDWLHHNRDRVGVDFEVAPSAEQAEMTRRKRELAKR